MRDWLRLGLVLCLAVLMIGMGAGYVEASGFGEIKTTDYGTTPTHGGAYFWRGYSFKLTQRTTVTHLIGGGQTATTSNFRGAIFSANVDAHGNATSPKEILRIVNFTGSTADQVVALSSNLILEADTWYYIAQGDMGSTPRVYHWYVAALDADDLVAASFRISDWQPSAAAGCHYWSAGDPASVVVGRSPTTNPSRPAIGFRYLSNATLPTVETTTTPMYGRLTFGGNAPTALYIEYGTNATLSSGTTLNLSYAGYEGSVPHTYGTTAAGLTPSTTYYYRARAINDAGRVDGVIRSFTTPDPPGAPTITSVTGGDGQLSVAFTPPPGGVDNYQYSLNGGAWTSRSPASSGSPLVIAGLSNGANYNVRIRAVHQGIVGTSSNTMSGTPKGTQGIPTVSFETPTYGSNQTLSWSRLSTAANGYRVEVQRDGGQWSSFHAAVAQPASGDTVSLPMPASEFDTMGTRSFRVRAVETATHHAGDYGVSPTRTVSKAVQTITFNTGEWQNKSYGDDSFTLSASSSSGLPVTLTSANQSIVEISGNTVTIKGAGSTTITASQPGNANYNPADSVGRSLDVAKAILTIAADDKSKVYGDQDPDLTFTTSTLYYGDQLNDVCPGSLYLGTISSKNHPFLDQLVYKQPPFPVKWRRGLLIS